MTVSRPELVHLPAEASSSEVTALLRRDGALILDGVLSSTQLDRLKSEIMPYVEATVPGRDGFTGRKTTRTGAMVARSSACRELVMHPTLIGACEDYLLPFADTFQLHLTQLIRIQDGQDKQPLHRDRLAWGGFLREDIEPQLNTIWAVTDFTEANGATQVVPGSHLWESARVAEPQEVGFAEMKAGSVLVYSGSVIHAGGANRSGNDRMGLNITYCLGWLRQEENQYLSCPPAIAQGFDPALQRLLGYTMGSYALGYFSPPLQPGAGPESVSPEWLFTGAAQGWGEEFYGKVAARTIEGAR